MKHRKNWALFRALTRVARVFFGVWSYALHGNGIPGSDSGKQIDTDFSMMQIFEVANPN